MSDHETGRSVSHTGPNAIPETDIRNAPDADESEPMETNDVSARVHEDVSQTEQRTTTTLTSAQEDHFSSLPDEVLLRIFSRLDFFSLQNASQLSRRLRRVVMDMFRVCLLPRGPFSPCFLFHAMRLSKYLQTCGGTMLTRCKKCKKDPSEFSCRGLTSLEALDISVNVAEKSLNATVRELVAASSSSLRALSVDSWCYSKSILCHEADFSRLRILLLRSDPMSTFIPCNDVLAKAFQNMHSLREFGLQCVYSVQRAADILAVLPPNITRVALDYTCRKRCVEILLASCPKLQVFTTAAKINSAEGQFGDLSQSPFKLLAEHPTVQTVILGHFLTTEEARTVVARLHRSDNITDAELEKFVGLNHEQADRSTCLLESLKRLKVYDEEDCFVYGSREWIALRLEQLQDVDYFWQRNL